MSDNSTLFPTAQDSGETEEEKKNRNQTSDIYNSDSQGDVNTVKENEGRNSLIQYRKKITPDGRIVRVLLSDGETSSGIDSVSSADGADDVGSDDMNAFVKNVFVEVQNEFAALNSEAEKLTPKKMNQQDIINGSEENDDKMDLVDSPPYGGLEEDVTIYEPKNSSEQKQYNYQELKRSEKRASSNRSDERIARRIEKIKKSKRSYRKRPSKRLSRSRSKSRSRRRLSSQEKRRTKISKRRLSRSFSRGRSRSLIRRRSRSLSRRRSRSSSRRRSRSSSRRRSRSLSRRRSRSLTKRRRISLSKKRSRSLSKSKILIRRRSKSPIRRSRSSSRKRSRSSAKSSSSRKRSRSSTKISSSRKRSKSHEKVSSTSYEKRESGIEDRDSSMAYYAVAEARRGRGVRDFGFQSTTIQVSSYIPPVFAPRYYWRGANKVPRGPGKGPYNPSVKRPHSTVYDEDSPPPHNVKKKSTVLPIKSASPANASKDKSSKTEPKQDQAETSSETSSRSSPDEANVFTDPEDIPLPRVPDSTGCGSSDVLDCHTSLPTVGLDNRPLVPGPTGLPVHISPTGVTIPYDMDGRRIPIGPNGHYLPLDVTGRLFPHVITGENNAVPIYISEDGVLRLPDARPVPFGFPHKLPVNIDGKMILMGPDSRPLVPCPNLPSRPPAYLNQVKNSLSPFRVTPKKELESPQSETNQVVDSSGIEVVDLDLSNDFDENRNIDSKSNEHGPSNDTQTKPVVVESTAIPLSDLCTAPDIKKILDSVDENLLRKVQELTQQQNRAKKKKLSLNEDPVVIQIRSVIKSLMESNYNPPQLGRFILPKVMFEPPECDADVKYRSPLMTNRVKLPFITADAEESNMVSSEMPESNIAYTFVSTGRFKVFDETTAETGGQGNEKGLGKCLKPETAEFGTQCDFTTEIISDYNLTVTKLRKEIMSLQNAYTTLLEMYERASSNTKSENKESTQ